MQRQRNNPGENAGAQKPPDSARHGPIAVGRHGRGACGHRADSSAQRPCKDVLTTWLTCTPASVGRSTKIVKSLAVHWERPNAAPS